MTRASIILATIGAVALASLVALVGERPAPPPQTWDWSRN